MRALPSPHRPNPWILRHGLGPPIPATHENAHTSPGPRWERDGQEANAGRRKATGHGTRGPERVLTSVKSPHPVLGHRSGGAGYRLPFGVFPGWGEIRTGGILVGHEVPEPILAWLEALNIAVLCSSEVCPRVLARRGVAASNVTTVCTSTEMEPPPRRLTGEALDAARSRRRHLGVDLANFSHTTAPLPCVGQYQSPIPPPPERTRALLEWYRRRRRRRSRWGLASTRRTR